MKITKQTKIDNEWEGYEDIAAECEIVKGIMINESRLKYGYVKILGKEGIVNFAKILANEIGPDGTYMGLHNLTKMIYAAV